MKHQLRSLAVSVHCLMLPAALADGLPAVHNGDFTDLRVGRTNILCYQEPCPRNGISRADRPIAPHDLLWSGDSAPPIRGSTEDRIRLLEHYGDGCTLINGSFDRGVLEVARILGPC